MQEIAGLTLGAVLVRRVSRLNLPLLRAAMLAQTADLVTFAFIFQNGGAGERNPIAHLIVGAAKGIFGSTTNEQMFVVNSLSFFAIIGLKLALIAFLVWVTPRLRQYQRPVLFMATAVGVVGAVTNLLSLPLFVGPGG
jgi:hypothetical protein